MSFFEFKELIQEIRKRPLFSIISWVLKRFITFCIAAAIENLACTHRAVETIARFRCVPSAPGRAIGTSPKGRRGRAHMRNRCAKRRRLRARTRSSQDPHGYTWEHRCRSSQRTLLDLTPTQLDARPDGFLSRSPDLSQCHPCGSYSRGCLSAAAV
jgi:hypothetical protein